MVWKSFGGVAKEDRARGGMIMRTMLRMIRRGHNAGDDTWQEWLDLVLESVMVLCQGLGYLPFGYHLGKQILLQHVD